MNFPANMMSDGTLTFLCLLAVLHDPEPPSLVCIDEPEVGLHPSLIYLLGDLLRDASERTQVIVATHSPRLISAMRAEDVVVVESIDGASHFKRFSSDELESLRSWLKDFSLGELWEQGEIGGRP
jgi:predicted ATPase